MNYYERHIGDYLKDTAHLSLLEHGIYTRLLDVYYTREGAIPESEAARLIGARSKDEREALKAVLSEFFKLVDGAFSQDRSDREIARFKDKQAKAKKSAEARWGVQPPQSEGNANASQTHDAQAMRTHSEGNATRARPQSPVTSNQTPKEESARNASIAERAPDDEPPETQGHAPTPAGAVCQAMRRAGLQATNPGDPRLLALIEQGATLPEFEGIAAEAVSKGKGWAWVLTVLPARRIEAAAIALPPAQQADPMAWTVSRRGVITRACELGIGPWDESNAAAGTGPSWPEYRAEVIAADAAQRQGIAA